MKNFLNPKWLFIVNTLPTIILFVLVFGQFNIIKKLLSESNIQIWQSFGLTLGILATANFIYAVYFTFNKQNISLIYCIVSLISNITFIYVYCCYFEKLMPFSIPRWMLSGNIFIYVGTFLMPSIAHSFFVLIQHFTPEKKEHSPAVNFLISIAIPIFGYLFSQIILPLWQKINYEFNSHVLIILVIVATLVFLFFLVRGIYILVTKKAVGWQKYQLAWKIPICILLPIVGLLVNNGLLFRKFNESDSGIFGDFNNHWFYILAIFNGILVCLPNLDNKKYRIILFSSRSLTFSYTFYFFIVFLPFLPLSVIAVMAVGTGFLMLVPLLLFVLHINELSKDFQYLNSFIAKKYIILISVFGFLIIPTIISITYLNDRKVLTETLAYLYSPDYSKAYNIDKTSLQKTLRVVKQHKEKNNDFVFGSQLPYLSSYFNWLVLDNLTLSDAKINSIEKIFFGTKTKNQFHEIVQQSDVKISKMVTKSIFDKKQNAWKTWIDLELTNQNETNEFGQYATTFDLPEGCWISDYYLNIGKKKEFGILAEKKTAMWVFSNIRNENKDPGILHYLSGNKVQFKVFPFSKNEIRKTGIEFLHKEPIKITIGDKCIVLGNEKETVFENVENKNVVYVSSEKKKTLKKVQRNPYFHFIVDVSKNKKKHANVFKNRIEILSKSHKQLTKDAQISFANTYVNNYNFDEKWKENYELQKFEGGFYLERAINKTLFKAYKSKTYPIIVIVTDSFENAVINKDFSDFKFAFPESDLFYSLNKLGDLNAHSLTENPLNQISDKTYELFNQEVLEFKLSDNSIAYLPNNEQPSVIFKNDSFEISEKEIKFKNWKSALLLQANWNSQILHPEKSDEEWLNLVKYSFISKVMTPITSYLVVENEAQKKVLFKKQKQFLAGNKALDLDEEPQRMSEPSLWIVTIIILILICKKIKTDLFNK